MYNTRDVIIMSGYTCTPLGSSKVNGCIKVLCLLSTLAKIGMGGFCEFYIMDLYPVFLVAQGIMAELEEQFRL